MSQFHVLSRKNGLSRYFEFQWREERGVREKEREGFYGLRAKRDWHDALNVERVG